MNTQKNIWTYIENLIHFIFYKVLRLKLTQSQWEGLMQFIKFGIVGLSNTVVSYVIYVAALIALQKLQLFPSVDYLIAQLFGFILSVLWSFYWNNKYVFEKDEERNILKALLKTYVSYAFTGLFLNSILSILWIELLHISKMLAPIINLLISVPLNFVMNKFWAFKK